MKNNISVFNGYIILNETLIKIKNICLVRPNPNKFIKGLEIHITGPKIIIMEHISMHEFHVLDTPLKRINDAFININKLIAAFPIPENYGYEGTFVCFEGTDAIALPNIESKAILDLINNLK